MTGVLAPLPNSQERQAHTEQQCGVGFRDDVERPGLKKTRGRVEQSGIEEDVFAWTAGVITDCQGAGAWGIPSEIDACEQDVVAAGAVRQEVKFGRDPEITRSTPETGKRDSGPEAVGRPVRARRCFGSRSRSYVPFRVLHDQRLPRYPRRSWAGGVEPSRNHGQGSIRPLDTRVKRASLPSQGRVPG